jgi:LysM repeat protein
MKKKIRFVIVLLLVFGLVLSGCVKSASEAPEGEETSSGEQADVVVRVMATQTALAKAAEGDAEPTEEPDDSAEPTAEPTEEPVDNSSGDPTEEPVADSTEEPTEEATVAAPIDVDVPTTYTIKYGEYPYCLARRFDINADDLLSANGLTRDDQVGIGTVLTIPQDSSGFVGSRVLFTHPGSFTVKYNDTFHSIACYFGDVFPEQIAAANSMTIDEVLSAGDVIDIP